MATELELIERIQKAKAGMAADLKELIRINREARRGEAQNAAFLTLARLNVWHGEATKELYANYPEFAAEVVVFGPGGR